MGGLVGSEKPSLDRLKALDALPDLDSQLEEVQKLCTHSARADMIAKWLLEKLKSSADTRRSPAAWETFTLTLRLLSPQRLALLLGSNNLAAILGAALNSTADSVAPIEALSRLVNFLIDVSESENGAPVQAALSLPAQDAASLLGLWLQKIEDPGSLPDEPPVSVDTELTLRPALHLWNVRRSSADDDMAFAKHCLVSTAKMLMNLQVAADVSGSDMKRRREGDVIHDHLRSVQSLLARHIFLPARNAFFKSQGHPTNDFRLGPGPIRPEINIETVLNSITETRAGDSDEETLHDAIPMLLDVALRCVPITTPRQRAREQPWVEAVFQALYDCNRSYPIGLLANAMLTRMLIVIQKRSTLSRTILERIVKSDSNVMQTPDAMQESLGQARVDWDVIAQVVGLDAELFCQRELAEQLFESITRACATFERLQFDPDPLSSSKGLRKLCSQQIVVPVMEAFAKSRRLPDFVDLWVQQLSKDEVNETIPVWTELDGRLAALVEDSMTEDAVVELLDQHWANVEATKDKESHNRTSMLPQLGPSVIVLNAVLEGVRSESLCMRLQRKCGVLFETLMQMCEVHIGDKPEELLSQFGQLRTWALLAKAFEIWYPSWTMEGPEPASVARRLYQWLSSNTIRCTLNIANAIRSDGKGSTAMKREADDAECLVGMLCSGLLKLKSQLEGDLKDASATVVDSFLAQLDPNNSQVLIRYPNLLRQVDNNVRTQAVTNIVLTAAIEQERPNAVLEQSFDLLAATISGCADNPQSNVVHDLVEICVKMMGAVSSEQGSLSENENVQRHVVALHIFSLLPINILSRTQRERLLNVLSTSRDEFKIMPEQAFQKRLALMIDFMQKSNATANILTDSSVVWQTALGKTAAQYITLESIGLEQFNQQATTDLLEELALHVVKQLISNQSQEKNRLMLNDLSRNASQVLDFCCQSTDVSQHRLALALSTAIIKGLEIGCKEDLLLNLPHRTNGTHTSFTNLGKTMNEMVTGMSSGSPRLEDSLPILPTISKALLTMAALQDANSIKETATSLVSVCQDFILQVPHDSEGLSAAAMNCYKLISKFAPVESSAQITSIALKTLDGRLTPPEIHSVVEDFAQRVDGMDAAHKLDRVQQLLQDSQAAIESRLLLLQQCIAKLDKDGRLANPASTPHLLPKLIKIAIENAGVLTRKRAVACIIIILKEKPFLVNQYGVESILTSLPTLLDTHIAASTAFFDVCRIISTLLLNHRARLHGRFHILIPIFQNLISALFSNAKRHQKNQLTGKSFDQTHAHALSRILVLFCEPSHLRLHSRGSTLVDESRKEQAHVGRHVQYILHHYCAQVLSGPLREGMKEALTPGLWSMIDAIESGDNEDAIRALSAAMSNSERAVLRGVYEDWKRFGKWRGG